MVLIAVHIYTDGATKRTNEGTKMNTAKQTKLDEYKALADVVAWTIAAAKEAVDLAPIIGEPVTGWPCMGLWQSFKERFDLDLFDDKDLAINLFLSTFKATVATFQEA